MHLWNDYEGKTLAGRWPLGRLLQTEGRSALFETTRDGRPSVLRLTEALNDQAVLRARFAAIQAAGDKYLVAIQEFGDAEVDGTPLSYAVLEPTQESLADILASRRLSPEETHDVALQIAGGLAALHAQGLVHGLVEPQSVLAAGDVAKLRSDCARPAPAAEDADLEGTVTPHSDAVGLAGVIYRALTQSRLQDAADALRLPEPYSSIVRNTLRNHWGVTEIREELMRPARAHDTAPAPAPRAASTASFYATTAAAGDAAPALGRATPADAQADSGWQQPERIPAGRRMVLFGIVGAAVLLILLFVLFHHHAPRPTPSPAAAQTTAMAPATAAAPAAATSAGSTSGPAAASGMSSAAAPAGELQQPAAKLGGPVWRVVAFTYNHKSQAEAKAASVNRHFRGFHAAVWSRTGSAPFLVTLDGTMTQKQAFGLRDHARAVGLARDVYAQDYSR